MKVQFAEDYSTRKKGEQVDYNDRFAEYLIGEGIAKKVEKKVDPVRKTKVERATRKTK